MGELKKYQKSNIKNGGVYMNRRENGFTLVELLVALVLTAIILVIAVKFFNAQNTAVREQEMIAECQANVRAATELITREIKLAGYHEILESVDSLKWGSNDSTRGILNASANAIEFWCDLNGSGTVSEITDVEEMRRFFLTSDSTLIREVYDRANNRWIRSPLARNIVGFNLAYRDINNANLGTPGRTAPRNRVSTVEITIRGLTRGDIRIGNTPQRLPREMTQEVKLRNSWTGNY